jgi:hypothetical protein
LRIDILISFAGDHLFMKTLQFQRDVAKGRVTVACADGNVSVYSHCAYCVHCQGIWVGKRLNPAPQARALADLRGGSGGDDTLMNAAMMFNTLVGNGTAVECNDDGNEGFRRLF